MDPDADADAHSPRARTRHWPIVCWLVILALIGIVQVVRAEWFDAAVFVVAIALVAVSLLLPRQVSRGIAPRAVIVSAALLAGAMSLLPRHSAGMISAALVAGAAAVAAAWPSGSEERGAWTPGLRRLGIAWATILIVGCLWELAEFIVGLIAPQHLSFALSDLVDPLLDTMLGRAVFVIAWLSCGAFLTLRGRSR